MTKSNQKAMIKEKYPNEIDFLSHCNANPTDGLCKSVAGQAILNRHYKKASSMGDFGMAGLVGLLVGAALFFGPWIGAAISYALNKTIIDAIPASSINWWNIFTFDNFWAWEYVNNPTLFFTIYGILAASFGIAVIILLMRIK